MSAQDARPVIWASEDVQSAISSAGRLEEEDHVRTVTNRWHIQIWTAEPILRQQ